MGGRYYKAGIGLLELLWKLDISRKYGLFAYFCFIAVIVSAIYILICRFIHINIPIYSPILLFRIVLISSILTLFEKFRIQNEPSVNLYFSNMTFKQQVQEVKSISENNGFGCYEEPKDKFAMFNKQILIEYKPNEYYQFQCSELIPNPRIFKVMALNSVEPLDTGLIKFAKNFTTRTDYANAMKTFQELFENRNVYEFMPKEYAINSKKKNIDIKAPVIEFDFNKTDINNATEEQLAALAGINIASAKKAIRYRDLKGGFQTFNEFAKVVNLKDKFIPQIRPKIEIGDYNNKQKNSKTTDNDRIVDF